MDSLRFAHHFFHFESAAWIRLLQKQPTDLPRFLFSDNPLPRRKLRQNEPITYNEAIRIHKELLERENSLGIRALAESNPEFPEALRQIAPERRPALLYVRGASVPSENHLVALVGTRNPSETGKEAAHSFSTYLSAIGIRTVSGLARGIDSIVHEQSAALGTIAILGAGIGTVYPDVNQALAEDILRQGGTLASPFPLDQVPLPQNFPDRNEIIAALSAGVIVIEGAEKSGAAITGRHALALGKTVVTLAQDFRSEFGRGAIRLQQDGAVLVTREEEAIEAVFRRFGGFAGALSVPTVTISRRSFQFRDFQIASGRSVPEALALLEEGILQGKIERFGLRYRLR